MAMDRRTRHDLRQPIATMSMIASTLAQLGESVGAETKNSYREQVGVELERLDELIRDHRASIDASNLKDAAMRFVENVDDPERSRDLQTQCEALLEALSKRRA
jgi:signal transduction histidine kinase